MRVKSLIKPIWSCEALQFLEMTSDLEMIPLKGWDKAADYQPQTSWHAVQVRKGNTIVFLQSSAPRYILWQFRSNKMPGALSSWRGYFGVGAHPQSRNAWLRLRIKTDHGSLMRQTSFRHSGRRSHRSLCQQSKLTDVKELPIKHDTIQHAKFWLLLPVWDPVVRW